MENNLPDLELIAAKLTTEVEVPTFATETVATSEEKEATEAAYTNMANIAEVEEL
jgi:hypothetical protein